MGRVPFWVVLDACVLYPVGLCDVLLSIADNEIFQPLWSQKILDELRKNVLEGRPDAKIDRRIEAMIEAFPDAIVSGFEPIESMLDNDPKDRHVLAAAIVRGAETIVTHNVKDFRSSACDDFDISIQTPDDFVRGCFNLDMDGTVQAIARAADGKKDPPITFDGLLDYLSEKAGCSVSVGTIRSYVARRDASEPQFLHKLLEEPAP